MKNSRQSFTTVEDFVRDVFLKKHYLLGAYIF